MPYLSIVLTVCWILYNSENVAVMWFLYWTGSSRSTNLLVKAGAALKWMLVKIESLVCNWFRIRSQVFFLQLRLLEKNLFTCLEKSHFKLPWCWNNQETDLRQEWGGKWKKLFCFKHCSFNINTQLTKNHHRLEFSGLKCASRVLSVSSCVRSVMCSLSGIFMNKRVGLWLEYCKRKCSS